MKFQITDMKSWLIASTLMACSPWVHATCYKVSGVGSTSSTIPQSVVDMGYTAASWGGALDAYASPISFGTIILGSGEESLAPAGTVLASAALNFVESAQKKSYSPNQILFKCAAADAGVLYEMYALNASSGNLYGGKETADVPGVYLTPAKNIGYRITNMATGLGYTNRWQERALTSDDYITIGNMIYIPASAFGSVTFDLVKTDDASVAGATDARNAFSTIVQPQGFVAFKAATALGPIGGAITTGAIVSSLDSANWPGVWSMRGGNTVVIRGSTCMLGDFDQVVPLPPISDGELRQGSTSTNTFNVTIECDDGAISGTATATKAPVAMGFLVSQPKALSEATRLGLTTSSGGVSYLLDDNYGAEGVASNVGIRISSALAGKPLNLLSTSGTTGTGNAAGWYGFADLLSYTADRPTGGKEYSGAFTASLEQLPGLSATAGSVNAQAQIIVSLQ